MNRSSIVVKLWVAIVALIAVTLVVLLASVAKVVSDFYLRTRVEELARHGQKIIDLAQAGQFGPESKSLIDLVADLSGATVAIVDPRGQVVTCSEAMAGHMTFHVSVMHDVEEAQRGRTSWSVTADPFTGVPALSVAMPLSLSEGPAALLFLAPTAPINETIKTIERVLLALAAAAIAAVTVLAFLLSRNLSRPLQTMAAAASEMAGGDFRTRIDVRTSDEVGQLGASLNNLSERLQESLAALARERDHLAEVLARERQLAQAQKEFLANVSHELRTPLSYLQGYSEAILDGLVDQDEQRKFLHIILDESQRLRRLVTDLLDLTVVESGQAPLRREPLPVAGIIHDVAVSMAAPAAAKDLSIVQPVLGPDDPPMVWADPDRTKQILVNLIDNAIRHSPAGSEVIVGVGPGPAEDAGERDWVWFSVTDRGPGLDQEALAKVWTRFFKADRSRHRDTSGTGLGLAIVRSLVEAQGGRVHVSSQPGKGATFSFSLPTSPEALERAKGEVE